MAQKTLLEQWQERAITAERRVAQALEMLRGSTSVTAGRAVDVLKGKYEIKTPEEKKPSGTEAAVGNGNDPPEDIEAK